MTAVAEAVIRARSGLKDPNRPIGSFIFMGPTGVGKTELARALAGFLFDDEHALGADAHARVGLNAEEVVTADGLEEQVLELPVLGEELFAAGLGVPVGE